MDKSLSPEEVAIIIRSRQILKEKGLSADIDVSGICKEAGVSRKTGYKWVEKHSGDEKGRQEELEAELKKLKGEYEQLKKDYDDVSFENRGRKLAWKIHHVDELLAEKKSSTGSKKEKKP
jgi:transposase-like protein